MFQRRSVLLLCFIILYLAVQDDVNAYYFTLRETMFNFEPNRFKGIWKLIEVENEPSDPLTFYCTRYIFDADNLRIKLKKINFISVIPIPSVKFGTYNYNSTVAHFTMRNLHNITYTMMVLGTDYTNYAVIYEYYYQILSYDIDRLYILSRDTAPIGASAAAHNFLNNSIGPIHMYPLNCE